MDLLRTIDKQTAAKSLFVKSGIPGSVGSSAGALWQELGPRLTAGRSFKVWPFDGDLNVLLESTPVVVGETYPRAAYATALLDRPAPERPRLALAKNNLDVRREAIAKLQAAEWVRRFGAKFENLLEAEANDHDFDACFTAVALLPVR